MIEPASFKRLILRAVLRQVSPMVIRLVSVPDQLDLPEFNDIFCAILGWSDDLGYLLPIHGQEFNSFRRKTRSKALHEFRLQFSGQEDVKKLIWLIFRDFNFDPECIPVLHRSLIEHPGEIL